MVEERASLNLGDAGWDGHAGQAVIVAGGKTYSGNTIGNDYIAAAAGVLG